jgi:hypothetical protein
MSILFLMFVWHAIADYALQSDFIAKSKSRHSGVPAAYNPKLHGPVQTIWPYVLTSHALIHGGGVAVITGIWWLGLLETLSHWATDFGKCEKWYGIHTDQFIHISCKFIWLAIYLAFNPH